MNVYKAFIAKQIAEEISAIQDPQILSIYLKAIQLQRCKIGRESESSTCKECIYKSYYCRQLDTICEIESQMFDDEEVTE